MSSPETAANIALFVNLLTEGDVDKLRDFSNNLPETPLFSVSYPLHVGRWVWGGARSAEAGAVLMDLLEKHHRYHAPASGQLRCHILKRFLWNMSVPATKPEKYASLLACLAMHATQNPQAFECPQTVEAYYAFVQLHNNNTTDLSDGALLSQLYAMFGAILPLEQALNQFENDIKEQNATLSDVAGFFIVYGVEAFVPMRALLLDNPGNFAEMFSYMSEDEQSLYHFLTRCTAHECLEFLGGIDLDDCRTRPINDLYWKILCHVKK